MSPNNSNASIGGVLRDSEARWLCGFSMMIAKDTIFRVEACAVLKGIMSAKQLVAVNGNENRLCSLLPSDKYYREDNRPDSWPTPKNGSDSIKSLLRVTPQKPSGREYTPLYTAFMEKHYILSVMASMETSKKERTLVQVGVISRKLHSVYGASTAQIDLVAVPALSWYRVDVDRSRSRDKLINCYASTKYAAKSKATVTNLVAKTCTRSQEKRPSTSL
ncbi:hypothetical protein GOBAR_AA28402 [Gossypium barbadense]|uniref:Uncharacterized protein n=1 Tax=Gossypium barbadense TaxID=3634 RepID=A0A2P5WMF7_GOSBA|nr:hypothetical protein GOBAR_AA28402 [Gossypium barbadense]